MKVRTITIIFILFTSILFAQKEGYPVESPHTYIYQLKNKEVTKIFESRKLEIEDAYFHTLIDTFSTRNYQKPLPPGHYLFVKAQWEKLNLELKSVNAITAKVLTDERDFAVQVADSLGKSIESATVFLGKKEVPFDPKTKSYRLKKWNKDGLLRIEFSNESLFYDVNRNTSKPLIVKRYWRFRSTKIGRIVTLPIRVFSFPIRYVYNGIRHRYWRLRLPFRNWFNRGKSVKGYIATNKPKYQPGDTVKVKAFITRPNGKPWNQSVDLRFFERTNKPIFVKQLTPTAKGNFEYEFVLGDSLELDKQYYLKFDPIVVWNWEGMTQRIFYEDYQLDEVNYTLKSSQNSYQKTDKIILTAEGKDKNNLTVPDGQVKLVATTTRVVKFHSEQVYIPDTIWVSEQALSPRGETQIIMPDSLLSSVDMEVKVDAYFSNSTGEMHQKQVSFAVYRKSENMEVRIENGFLVADYFLDGDSTKTQGTLYRNTGSDIWTKETIELPFKSRISPFINEYKIEVEEEKKSIFLHNRGSFGSKVSASGECRADSVYIQISNPHQIPVHYLIQTKNQVVERGSFEGSNFIFHRKAIRDKAYFLKLDYVWGNRNNFIEETFQPYKKLLTIEVEQSESISPGETVSTKIKVKNYKNKPAKKVNLTAGAINSQFNMASNYRAPQIQYKAPKEPFEFYKFRISKPKYPNRRKNEEMTRIWYKRMGLDSLLFYKMRFENEGVLMNYYDIVERDTFYKNVAQFSPYLIEKGKALPIYLIYCNNELVYWYDVDDDPPYSFIGQEGWNTILIRTKEWEYKIDSVWLKKGHKLELAIDVDNYGKSKFGKNIKLARTQEYLTDFEKDLLRKRIFVLRTTYKDAFNHVWQSANNIHIFRQINKRDLAIGPFKGYTNMTFLVQGGFSNNFLFEPGFQYDILKNRERLYQDTRFLGKVKHKLTRNELQKPGQLIYTPSNIKNELPEHLEIFFSAKAYQTNRGNGTYQIEAPKDSTLIAFVLEKNDTTHAIFDGRNNKFYNIQPGKYQFYGFTLNANYFQAEIQIKGDTLLFTDLTKSVFRKDTALFNQFFKWTRPTLNLKSGQNQSISSTNFPRIPLGTGAGRYVKGCVTDEDGEPLIGASILIKGTSNGTVTDIDGCYELWLPEGFEDIIVNYTGYSSEELSLSGLSDASVTLASGDMLEEVVVTGLGRSRIFQKTSTSALDIRNLPTRNITALASVSAGVHSGAHFNIRGSRTLPTNYYLDGIRVTDGIPMEDLNSDMDLGDSGIRTNFSDYAYWEPFLLTDEKGEAFFNSTFPDNITSWKTFVLGQDSKSRGGVGYANTRAFKKLMAQLAMPRFLVEGDELNIVGRSLNYTNDTFEINTVFKLEDEILRENKTEIKEALIENFEINAPSQMDSLKMSYSLSMGDYVDGEVRQIPIFPKGVEETIGGFHILEGDTSLDLSFDKTLGEVTIFAQKDVLKVLLEDIEYLKNYPYGCNEQTASRLTALLLEKQIRANLGESFQHEKDLIAAIVRLKKTQNANGSWGWWTNGKDNIWMTTYVLRALYEARQQNYRTEAFDKGLKYLTNSVHTFEGKDLLNTLQLFSDVDQNFDYQPFINRLDTTLTTLYDKFALLEIRQSQGLEMNLDTLKKYQKRTVFGSIYWNEDRYNWYDNSIQTSLLGYKILKNAGQNEDAKKVRQYFLEKRSVGKVGIFPTRFGGLPGWRNTIETARILAAILPDLSEDSRTGNLTLTVGDENVSAFPYQVQMAPDNVRIQKKGGGQLFLTAYQSFQNKAPKSKSDIFEVDTHLEQNGKKTKQLQQAEKATLVVRLEVKESADYAMIEVPIPAGCSYGSKENFRRFPEVHREYFREKASIFCENLPVGEYVFKIDLEPRFTGNYSLNPAKVEQMYFPIFYGRNEMKEVRVD